MTPRFHLIFRSPHKKNHENDYISEKKQHTNTIHINWIAKKNANDTATLIASNFVRVKLMRVKRRKNKITHFELNQTKSKHQTKENFKSIYIYFEKRLNCS